MERPLKKKRRPSFGRENFLRVLPFLFPGFYGENFMLAFRTFLALCGVCRALRYWNVLRRWVAYTCPDFLKTRLLIHSFPCGPSLSGLTDFQELAYDLLAPEALKNVPEPVFNSDIVLQSFFNINSECQMETEIGGTPFFGLISIHCSTGGLAPRVWRIRCMLASNFSEMVLFCHAACLQPIDNPDDAWCVIANWKTQRYTHIYFRDDEKARYRDRYLLGRLKRIGLTAPQDLGFHKGSLPETSYSWFCKHCDTTGTRSKLNPAARLNQFVRTWFPNKLVESEAMQAELPYVFPINSFY